MVGVVVTSFKRTYASMFWGSQDGCVQCPCGVGKDSSESLALQGDQTSQS